METQHEQAHVADAPDFGPADPQSAPRPTPLALVAPLNHHVPFLVCAVQVFIRSQQEDSPAAQDEATDASDSLLSQTIEYDVFACDAFVEDLGKWIRLMPEAGFVPT